MRLPSERRVHQPACHPNFCFLTRIVPLKLAHPDRCFRSLPVQPNIELQCVWLCQKHFKKLTKTEADRGCSSRDTSRFSSKEISTGESGSKKAGHWRGSLEQKGEEQEEAKDSEQGEEGHLLV